MRAAFLNKHGGPDVIEVGDVPTPGVSQSDVLVRLKVGGLNHLDLWVRRGIPGLKLAFPHILGGDGAGTVARVGSEVRDFKEGDEVIVHPGLSCLRCEVCLLGWESLCPQYRILGEHMNGTHAEFVCVPAANIFMKPKSMPFPEAGTGGLVFTTAWQMLVRRARVRPGDLVLVHGAGSGVSHAAIQIAVLFGAEVIATSTKREKLAVAKRLGAKHTICTSEVAFDDEVRKLSKRGVDIIVDHIGQIFWEKNLKVLRWGGTLVTCGATSGWEAKTDLRQVFYRQISLLGSTMGSKGDFPRILRLLETGKLRVLVGKLFSLPQCRDAHVFLEEGGQAGKVGLNI